jgi:hypothetical protein
VRIRPNVGHLDAETPGNVVQNSRHPAAPV